MNWKYIMHNFILIIPTLNEEKTINTIIQKSLNYFEPNNIIVIDGHSSDKTPEIVKSHNILLLQQTGKGKGNAIIDVLNYINNNKYDYNGVVFIDGDLTYDISEVNNLIEPIIKDKYDMVIGNRLNGKREKNSITRFNLIGNWIFSILIRLFHGSIITDTQTGYRALSKSCINNILPHLKSNSFDIETEMNIIVARKKLKIYDVPISYYCRPIDSYSKLNPMKIGLKILWRIIEMRFRKIS